MYLLADIGDVLPILIPIIVVMIPIVAILTKHQQRMAEIIHQRRDETTLYPQVEALRGEIRELRTLLHQHTINMDNLLATRATANEDEVRKNLISGT